MPRRGSLRSEVRPEIWTQKRRGLWNMHSRTCRVLLTILAGEFLRRQVAQRRMYSLGIVHIIQEITQLTPGVGEVLVLRQRDLFLLDRPHQSFGISILLGHAHARHAD